MLQPGDIAPGLTLRDQNGEAVKLSDFKGQTLVLFFYPRADTVINSNFLR
ncbi:MAG TPA: redoxin domain-containing protein [Solirubrobacterales bacterium]|nr:redoxin domain-containing protein [Solirubrobacterales bacterium]